jgi:hypothetical protein
VAGIGIPDVMARKNCIVQYCNHQNNFPLACGLGFSASQQIRGRIPVNFDRCYQPDDLKRTEFGQGEAHLFDAFR